jgi:CBS domain-containing protein
MNKVKDMLAGKSIQPVVIDYSASVIDALTLMSLHEIGSVIVMDKNKYLGILTERDYARKVLLKGKNSSFARVTEIMSVDLPVLGPEDTVEHCMEVMSDKNIRYLPVFENSVMVGIISISDVVRQTILIQAETIHQLENYIHH